MAVVKPGSMGQLDHFEAQIYLLSKEEGGLGTPITPEVQQTVFSKTYTIMHTYSYNTYANII